MKKIAAIASILVLSAFTYVTDEWKTVTLLDKVTVNMAGEIKDEMVGPQKIKKSTLSDSSEIAAILIDFSAFGLTEELLNGMKETEEFKEQVKMGVTQSGGKILAEKSGTYLDKYFYHQFNVEMEKDGKKFNSVNRMVFYKTYAITLLYKPAKIGLDSTRLNQFYNSLKIAE